jgi:hypothetical protein
MRAFIAEDRQTRDSFAHVASVWNIRDWLALVILVGCFAGKAILLINFGAYQPAALLALNWAIATVEFCLGLDALTTRVPAFLSACLFDFWHLRKRLRDGARYAGNNGVSKLGTLPFKEFPFVTAVMLRTGQTGGHELVLRGRDGDAYSYVLYAAGTVDDADRASFLHCQPDHLAQAALARALGAIQLEQLNSDPTRAVLSGSMNTNPPTPLKDIRPEGKETDGDAKAA